jgi:hypothetical protein
MGPRPIGEAPGYRLLYSAAVLPRIGPCWSGVHTKRHRPWPAFPQVRPGAVAVSTSALGGIRTPNLLIRSQMLYPLSYERRVRSSVWLLTGSNSPRY